MFCPVRNTVHTLFYSLTSPISLSTTLHTVLLRQIPMGVSGKVVAIYPGLVLAPLSAKDHLSGTA